MESQRSQPVNMERKGAGGRPPKIRIKYILKNILRELGTGDVNLIRNKYEETTGQTANYHTIKKYLDLLVKEDLLRVQVVQDNLNKIEMGGSRLRRRVFFYVLN